MQVEWLNVDYARPPERHEIPARCLFCDVGSFCRANFLANSNEFVVAVPHSNNRSAAILVFKTGNQVVKPNPSQLLLFAPDGARGAAAQIHLRASGHGVQPHSPTKSAGSKTVSLCLSLAIWVLHLACAGSLIAGDEANKPGASALVPARPRELVDFALTNRTGRLLRRSDLAGKYVVVNFVTTGCSMTCRVVGLRMQEIQKQTKDLGDVVLLSISLTPNDDTPEVLAKFGTVLEAEEDRWFFVTGNQAEVYGLISASFLSQDRNNPENTMPGWFTHSDWIALVDRQGKVVRYFEGLKSAAPGQVMQAIAEARKSSRKSGN